MSLYTASQAQSAVVSYDLQQASEQQDALVAEYQWIFDKIQLAASQGLSHLELSITRADYSAVGSLLIDTAGYGIVILATLTTNFPSDGVADTDNTRRYPIRIYWPGTTVSYDPILNISPLIFSGTQYVPLSVQFVVTGGVAPYTFVIAGPIPDGTVVSDLTQVNTFTISGTPTTVTDQFESLTVTVTDSVGQTFYNYVTYNIKLQPLNVYTTAPGINALSYDQAGSFTFTPYALPTASTLTLGGVKIDNSSITISNGVISATAYALPTASTTTLGGVKIDGTTVTINNGVITAPYTYTLPTSTASVLGGVKIDDVSIGISNGVISSKNTYIDSRARAVAVAISIGLY